MYTANCLCTECLLQLKRKGYAIKYVASQMLGETLWHVDMCDVCKCTLRCKAVEPFDLSNVDIRDVHCLRCETYVTTVIDDPHIKVLCSRCENIATFELGVDYLNERLSLID